MPTQKLKIMSQAAANLANDIEDVIDKAVDKHNVTAFDIVTALEVSKIHMIHKILGSMKTPIVSS